MPIFKMLFSWALFFFHLCYATSGGLFPKLQIQKEYHQKYLAGSKDNANASCNSPSCYRYYNSKTAPYFIESWPDVPFATGEFYGGSVPIDESDPSRTLFFIFKPAESLVLDAPTNKSVNEVTIWLNGGPGCSSLGGFLTEVGPIIWFPGTMYPRRNEWAWSKLTNMLWVEQPVGTGFSQGKVTARNEEDVAKDFLGFFKNWQKLFGIEDYSIYITGESYAGRYIPYIGAAMLDQKDTTYFDLKGALMYDPCIGDCLGPVQSIYPLYYDILAHNEIYGYDEETVAEMGRIDAECGLSAYLDRYLQYPPPGNQPTYGPHIYNSTCYAIFPLFRKIYDINPCFNFYHITDTCPFLFSPVTLFGRHSYFQRADVKAAIHAPASVNWTDCSYESVFVGYKDRSPDVNVDGGPLPQIIEATNRVLVSNGDWDALLYSNGTLLSIQNMTWNGALGFQSAPTEDFRVPLADPHPQGILGKMHYERGLQWVQTYQAGHMQPQNQPRAAFRHLQWLLGRLAKL